MPAIPIYEQRTSPSVGPPSLTPRQPAGIGQGISALGAGAVSLAEGLQAVRERDAALWATKALSDTQSTWLNELQTRKESADPGAPDFTGKLLKDFDERSTESLSNAPTPNARNFMQERLLSLRTQLQQQAMAFEADARVAHTEQVVQDSVDSAGNELLNNPGAFAERLAERRALIDATAATPQLRQKLLDNAADDLARYSVIGKINAAPYQTMVELANASTTDAAISRLRPDDRLKLIEHADTVIRQQLSDASRIESEGAKADKVLQDNTAKDGDKLLANGQLSASWIEANRDAMSQDDYRYFYKALTDDSGANRNVIVYSDLRSRAGNGQDVREEARTALQRRSITPSDYDRIIGEVEQNRPSWYKRGVQFISTAAAVSDLNPDPAAAQRKAAMLDDWGDWSVENPKASDKEALDAYRRIVSEYMLVDQRNFTIVKRAPRFLVGSRMAPDIAATSQATVQAFQKGEITEDEFNRQAALILEWQQALAEQQK